MGRTDAAASGRRSRCSVAWPGHVLNSAECQYNLTRPDIPGAAAARPNPTGLGIRGGAPESARAGDFGARGGL